MASDVERRYGVPLAHEALLRWLGEQYGPAAEQEARAVYAAANRRYQRAAKVRAEALWLLHYAGRLDTPARARRAAKARAITADWRAYIDGATDER